MSTRGWESATEADVRDRRAPTKPSKYRNVKTVHDGITFDSKREADRYLELKLLEKAGEIFHVVLQPVFPLGVPGARPESEPIALGRYVADFSYVLPDRSTVIEDVKGVKTPLYRWKKKHVEAQYGITIRET